MNEFFFFVSADGEASFSPNTSPVGVASPTRSVLVGSFDGVGLGDFDGIGVGDSEGLGDGEGEGEGLGLADGDGLGQESSEALLVTP